LKEIWIWNKLPKKNNSPSPLKIQQNIFQIDKTTF